ncbi:MAG TPA: signal peptidase II [Gemmatimonadaceae bacterium]
MSLKKPLVFWPLVGVLLLADCTSKRVVAELLELEHVPHDVFGDIVRFTLAYNPGAAFSVSLGEYSRWIFSGLAITVLLLLLYQYHRAEPHDNATAGALGLIAAGASGNLLDRLRSPRGVVDFIDIGFGDARFYTFNLADVAVFSGAVMLALLLIRRERDEALAQAEALVSVEAAEPAPSMPPPSPSS